MASLLERLRASLDQHNLASEIDGTANFMPLATAMDEEPTGSPSSASASERLERKNAEAELFNEEPDNPNTDPDRQTSSRVPASASTEMVAYRSSSATNFAPSGEKSAQGLNSMSLMHGRAATSSPSDDISIDGEDTSMDTEDSVAPNSAPAGSPSSVNDIHQETLHVVKWARDVMAEGTFSDAPACLVTTHITRDTGTNAKVWTSAEYLKELQARHPLAFQQCPYAAATRISGFSYGWPIKNISVPIQSRVGRMRPKTLYRAVHDKMPYEGMSARGLEVCTTNALFFQRHVQNHFVWRCRQPSPFMSATSNLDRAVSFAAFFEARAMKRGYTAIKILKIDTTGEYWDHNVSRLWEANHIIQTLGLVNEPYHDYEYLVKNLIPREHVEVLDWDKHKDTYDPGRVVRSQHKTTFKSRERSYAKQQKKKKEKELLQGKPASTEKKKSLVPKRTTRFKSVISHSRKKKS